MRIHRTLTSIVGRMNLGATALALAVASACQLKTPDFFAPPTNQQNAVKDVDPPVFQNALPASTATGAYNIQSTSVDIADLIGSNGAAPSGVDWTKVFATIGSQTLPLTHSGNTATASLAGMADGQLSIGWTASDLRSNKSTYSMNWYKKTVGPTINFTSTPQSAFTSNGPSVTFSLGGTVTDPYFGTAVGAVLKPGTDNTCNTATVPWPAGSAGGDVSGNTWDYTNTVKTNGTFTLGFTAYNPVPAGGSAQTSRYCLVVNAADLAMDATGAPKPNTSTKTFTSDLTWGPPPSSSYTVTLTPSYLYNATAKEVCVAISTTPAQLGATYAISISGPGTVNPTSKTGALDASGAAKVQFAITQTGTYTGAATVGSVAATYSITVGTTPGTCA